MTLFTIIALLATTAPAAAPVPAPSPPLDVLIGRYMARAADQDFIRATALGVPVGDPSKLPDRSPANLAAIAGAEDRDLAALERIDTRKLSPQRLTDYAILRERLEANKQTRVCRRELWDVSHITGWPAIFVGLAAQQPVDTPEARSAALKRWRSLPRFVDTDIANLRRGLARGYSAPQAVVRRVIVQVGKLSSGPADHSPFYSPAARAHDPAFSAAFGGVVEQFVQPALKRYETFLKNEYLPKARSSIALSQLPNGAACYRALLRVNTTIDQNPRAVFDAGKREVAANRRAVIVEGKRLFGISDFAAIVAKTRAQPGEHFSSAADLLAFSRQLLERTKKFAETLVVAMPRQDVVIEPERPFAEVAGVNSHYQPSGDPATPAIFRIQLGNWRTQTKADAEITTIHETWPGHHLQIALARESHRPTPLERIAFNAAYVEGWARTVERLGDEEHFYRNPDAGILQRAWAGRGMVVDPGIHVENWSRKQAVDFIVKSGKLTEDQAEDMVDRIAAYPGQLAAYDVGAIEIRRLREKARQTLGSRFDMRKFDSAILDGGIVPLSRLKQTVAVWINCERQSPASAARPLCRSFDGGGNGLARANN